MSAQRAKILPFSNSGRPDFLEKNLTVLEGRWPQLAAALRSAPDLASTRWPDETPQPTLQVEGLFLSSGYDRAKEAALQASLVPTESREAWVYGVGAGDVPRVLLARRGLKRLSVVVLNAAVARASLSAFDHRDWLNEPRIDLVSGHLLSALMRPFAAVPPCLLLADDPSARLRDLVLLELATPYIHQKQGAGNPEIAARLEENRDLVAKDGDAETLLGTHPGGTVLVAGAGPTLVDGYEWMRRHRGNYPLIAVDSALKPLVAAGLFPDVVVAVDGDREALLKMFAGLPPRLLQKIPLVYFPCVHRDVLEAWPGPRLVAYPDNPLYRPLAEAYPRHRLFSSGSVLHPAIDLAIGMGAAEIILFGADFGFPEDVSHVPGAVNGTSIETNAWDHWVLDWGGKRLRTSLNLRGYLRDLEGFITRHPEVRFVNAGRRGARIAGVSVLKEGT